MSEESAKKEADPVIPEISAKQKAKKLEVQLPYLHSPGTIKTALERIRQAALPERVHQDFVNTILQIKGGTGNTVAPFLKRIGMLTTDGQPTTLYKQFRNVSTGGSAIAAAIKEGYKPLGDVREYFYKLNETDLRALIVQVTGADPKGTTVKQILSSLNALKEFANFDESPQSPADNTALHVKQPPENRDREERKAHEGEQGVKLNMAYNINLNLPATSDQAVFNAIFRSLKEHLLSYED